MLEGDWARNAKKRKVFRVRPDARSSQGRGEHPGRFGDKGKKGSVVGNDASFIFPTKTRKTLLASATTFLYGFGVARENLESVSEPVGKLTGVLGFTDFSLAVWRKGGGGGAWMPGGASSAK